MKKVPDMTMVCVEMEKAYSSTENMECAVEVVKNKTGLSKGALQEIWQSVDFKMRSEGLTRCRMTPIKKLAKLHDKYDVLLSNEMRRMEGEDGERDFFSRYMWELTPLEGDDKGKECEWEGFATSEECIADLLKQT